MRSSRSKSVAIALAATAFSLSPAIASAATEQRTVGVVYADLDLSTDEGVAELDRRIEHAARAACNLDEHAVGSRIRSRDARQCYEQARQQLDRHFAQVLRTNQPD